MRLITLITIALLSIVLCLQSCIKDDCTNEVTFLRTTPVYMTEAEIRQDITVEAAQTLKQPGKIYFYRNYIFLNESREGIHIINNSDPSNPINEAFINIPCNVDMAVKNGVLYADNCIDLLAIDISSPTNPVLKTRTKNVFEAVREDPQQGLLVYNKQEIVTETVDCNDNRNFGRNNLDALGISNESSAIKSGNGLSGAPGGQGGSMARFTIAKNYLYTVDENDLNIFNIEDACNPSLDNKLNIGWGIETIYPYKNNLFIGSQTGMFIYNIDDAANPQSRGAFTHARACDPVVVKDNYAYVTLRGGTRCEGFNNQLDVIDVSDIYKPVLKKTYPMDGPYGLAITEKDVLYICDGESGLRVYDADDPLNLDQLHREKGMQTYDVIALQNDVIMVIGPDGLYQYDASDKKKLKELSLIAVEKN